MLSFEFEQLFSRTGSPSTALEKLLRALFQQAFYSVRSARRLRGLKITPYLAHNMANRHSASGGRTTGFECIQRSRYQE